MTERLGISREETLRSNLDEMIGKHNSLVHENKVLADAVATLSRKLTVRRAISKARMETISTLRGKNIALTERIKQGDEELRLLMCDIYPDGRTRGHISMMDKIERDGPTPEQIDRFSVAKIAGLQNKNQEIGSQLGYYKQETAKLRKMLITAQHSRDAWKRKAHHQLIPVPVDFSDTTVGIIV